MERFVRDSKFTRYLLALGLALVVLMPAVGWGEVLKVSQPNQSLYPDPDFASPPVGPVPVGAEVNVERQAGDWYKVEYEGKPAGSTARPFLRPRPAPNSVWAGC